MLVQKSSDDTNTTVTTKKVRNSELRAANALLPGLKTLLNSFNSHSVLNCVLQLIPNACSLLPFSPTFSGVASLGSGPSPLSAGLPRCSGDSEPGRLGVPAPCTPNPVTDTKGNGFAFFAAARKTEQQKFPSAKHQR